MTRGLNLGFFGTLTMKLFAYLFLFLAILGVAGFAFFTISTPNIPQTQVTKDLDPKDAFGEPPPLAPVPVPSASATPDPSTTPEE